MAENGNYSNLPQSLQKVHWEVEKVEEDLEKECSERKENDKQLFDKFDKMQQMVIYQLCAAILTLVVVVSMFFTKG